MEAFGRVPAIRDVDIDPSGTHLAWIDTSGKLARIVIWDIAAHREIRSMASPAETTLRAVWFADDQTLLAEASVTHSTSGNRRERQEYFRWFAIPVADGEPRMLLLRSGPDEWQVAATIVRRHVAKPGKIFMASWNFNGSAARGDSSSISQKGYKYSGWEYSLFEVDLKSGSGVVVAHGTPFTQRWVIDAKAEHPVRSDWNPATQRFSLAVKQGESWQTLYDAGRCGRLDALQLTSDDSALLAMGRRCNDPGAALWMIALDGSNMKLALDDPANEAFEVVWDAFDDSVEGVVLSGREHKRLWLDESAERRWNGLRRSMGADWVRIVGSSADRQRIVVKAEGPSKPPVFYFVDFAAKRADIINETYPLLNDVKLGGVREFSYAGRDGYPLIAYLTIPAGAPEKGLPIVVVPHGGPEDDDWGEFDWFAQFLASRGYAVLQPQFRGSTGFGKAHADAGHRQWGLRMQDDVTDAIRALMASGIADPKRICIAGSDFGGYTALAGAAFTPDLYACAVSVSGFSDLPRVMQHVRRADLGDESSEYDYWKETIGLGTDPEVIAKSPARSAATVKVPILLIHGKEDTVALIEQSRAMAYALKQNGKQYLFVELPGEDHWLSNSPTRIRALTEIEHFLAKRLGATPK